MIELWLFVSMACVNVPIQTATAGGRSFVYAEKRCYEIVRKSTSSVALSGETAYRVIPATATACDIVGHSWKSEGEIVVYFANGVRAGPDRGDLYKCSRCQIKLRKITKTEEKWVEE